MVQQRRAAARLLCNCQDTGILTLQWPPCACDLQSTVVACVSVFFCVRHSTRTQFLHASAGTDHRIHSFQAHPSQRSTAAAALQASLAARLHGNLCEIPFKGHLSSRSLFAGHWPVSALPPAKRCAWLKTCRSRPVSARCTRCRCYNVFVLVLHSHHKSIGGRLLLLPQAVRDWQALCHLS